MLARLRKSQHYSSFRQLRWQIRTSARYELDKIQARLKKLRSDATCIGVTGSSGKTTTTALTGHILSGVEKTLVQADDSQLEDHVEATMKLSSQHRFIVGEIGASGPGSLKPIVDFVRPQVGIVTLVALEHKSAFRTCEAVQEDKQTLVEALPSHGLAILNYDDSRVVSMAARTKARVKTFGETGGDYIISNVCADNPAGLTLSISHDSETVDLKTQLTGAHQSVPIAAAFACARELGVPASICQERIASFKPVFGRCSVHAIEDGPIFIADSVKAPYHSVYHAIEMMKHFRASRKRIVIGQISDVSSSRAKYRDIYRASRDVAEQVIYVGENSHRSKATAEEIAAGRFVEKHNVEDAASYIRGTAIPGEVILLKSSVNLHLERILLSFISDVRCWEDKCGKRAQCVECGLYGRAFDEHPHWSPLKPWYLDEVRDPVSANVIK